MTEPSPFHAGERAVQTRVGVHDKIAAYAREVVRPYLPEQHRAFYTSLPCVVAAARDRAGQPWATLLAGAVGFVTSPDPGSLLIRAQPAAGDALADSLKPGMDLGLLGIEFATRRRNRVNGRIAASDTEGVRLAVDQSFGNCPQYIHTRAWEINPDRSPSTALRHDHITPALAHWIARADTFFVASGHRDGDAACYGMDASHRGGEAGFVNVLDAHTLAWPDYAGNNYFNTLGNLLLDPRVGLLFVDFARGDLLQISGHAEIDWDSPALAATPGARRLVTVKIAAAIELRNVLPIRWRGSDVALRALRISAKQRESADVMSLVLEALDGGELPAFEPGQHLPIELTLPDRANRVTRTYSLSAAPSKRSYRLTIKRESQGLVSRYLHDSARIGDTLCARAPADDFTLRGGTRAVMLISAGVGITPMLSMLAVLCASHEQRRVWFVHGARDSQHHPLAAEVSESIAGSTRVRACIAYSRPQPHDRLGVTYDHHGRVDAALIAALLPDLDADFYLCGPAAFMAGLSADLTARGVPGERIHAERFG